MMKMGRVTRATTRALVKQETEIITIATLSSPQAAPIKEETIKSDKEAILPVEIDESAPNAKRHAAASQKRKMKPEPVSGGWDVLPHGMGKKGDLLEENGISVDLPVATDVDPEITSQEKRPYRKPKVETSQDVVEKANELRNVTESLPKPARKKKHPYGLTPGDSPFPNQIKPTPQDCEEVTRLLSALHGEVKPPDVIPPPSMEVAGCGEVPDLLDAILRTLLSASTTANNANMSLKGLRETFGLRESGKGEGSIKWEAVREADLATVVKSIEKGGLAQTKGKRIKEILEIIYQQNSSRRDKLIEERQIEATSDGKPKEALAKKDLEIAKIDQNLLSMDFVFELTTDEAMDEMTKLPGIGVKTASCVILFCMKRPSFAVDTHVWRHCKWLGWVPPTATRDQTFSHCEVRIPDHLKYPLHQLFLRHGKTCGRCRGATSAGTEEWNNTICPIDHLVNRTGARKMGHGLPKGRKAKSASTSEKRKRDEDTEESELEEPVLEEDDE